MTDDLRLSADEMRAIGYRVIDAIVDRFERIEEYPAVRVGSREDLLAKLSQPMPEEGRAFDEILASVERDVLPFAVTLAHPRFFAFVPGPGNFIGSMADTLCAGYNPFVGTWLGGSGPSALEMVTIGWLREMCGLPESGGGLFTSGGASGNFTALAAARHALAPDGCDGRSVYYGDQTHYTNERALRLIGVSAQFHRVVPSTPDYRMDTGALRGMVENDVAAGLEPLCVVASAGTTNVGAVDELDDIAELCRARGMWFHVDGAYGAAAALSPRLRPLLRGMEKADSVTLDPHKWLFQPFEIGCVLVRDMSRLRNAFQIMPDYLKDVHDLGEINFADHGVQLTRGFRALKLWMSLQYFGAKRFRRAIEHGVELAEHAGRVLSGRHNWQVVTPAQLAVISFRYVPASGDDARADEINDGIVRRLMVDGFAMVSSTILDGRTVLRFCTINPSTTENDIEKTIQRLEDIAGLLEEESSGRG